MPTTAAITGSTWRAGASTASAPANSLPISEPRNRAAENRPPRKPEPSEHAAASTFSTRMPATARVTVEWT